MVVDLFWVRLSITDPGHICDRYLRIIDLPASFGVIAG